MKKINIVGGGVSGLCSAYFLAKEGYKVTILERESEDNLSCSLGNAGMIVPSHIVPLASPGMIKKGFKWIFSSKSPFYIKPRLNKDLIKWLWRFYKSSNKQNVEKAIPVLKEYNLLSQKLFADLQKDFDFPMDKKGLFMACNTSKQLEEEKEFGQLASENGLKVTAINDDNLKNIEPNIKMDIKGGILFDNDSHITPSVFISGLKKYLKDSGVRFIYNAIVDDFVIKNNEIKGVISLGRTYNSDFTVLSSGVWTASLCKKLGVNMLMQGGKGYSFDVESVTNINTPTILCEAKVAVTPMKGFTRFAGTMEVNGENIDVNNKRVEGIIDAVLKFYPDIKREQISNKKIWKGLRPCSPDGLPYMGKLSNYSNVVVATGHAMMGLSMGPATGLLVKEMIVGEKASVELRGMNVERYS